MVVGQAADNRVSAEARSIPIAPRSAPGNRIGGFSEARASAFAAALARSGPAASASAGTPTSTEIDSAAPVPTPHGWTRLAGPKIARLFEAAMESAIESTGREPNEADDSDVEELGEALAQQLAVWFPDAALSPFKSVLLAAATVGGEMWIGARKMSPEEIAELRARKAAKNAPRARASAPPAATPTPMPPASPPIAPAANAAPTAAAPAAVSSAFEGIGHGLA
jgi:hypothetical protein